jgi:hypothetical protein
LERDCTLEREEIQTKSGLTARDAKGAKAETKPAAEMQMNPSIEGFGRE